MRTSDKRTADEGAADWYAAELAATRGRLSASRARDLITDAYKFHCGEHLQQETVSSWSEAWLENKSPSLTSGSFVRYKGIVQYFVKALGQKASLPLEHFTVQDAQEYRKKLLATGKSNRSVNLDFKVIRSMFRYAHRSNLIDFNPLEAIESLPVDGESHVPFTLQQVADIIEVAKDDWKTLVILGFTTGARLGDLARLEWKNIDWEKKLLCFRQTKTKRHLKSRDLVLPIHPMFERQLKALGAPKKKGPLMPEISNIVETKGTGGRQGLSRLFLELMDVAKVEQPEIEAPKASKQNGRKGARLRPLLSFHSFRHTLASILHNAGVAPEIRQKITGHASAAVHQIYTHTEIDTLRNAILRLPEPGVGMAEAG
jgi:integrase